MLVHGKDWLHPQFVGSFVQHFQAIGGSFIRTEDAKVLRFRVQLHHVAKKSAKYSRGLHEFVSGLADFHGVLAKVGHDQITQQKTAVCVRVGTHPAIALGREIGQV